jgi:hypothetical protein
MNLKSDLKEFEDWRLVGVTGASVGDKILDWGIQLLSDDQYKDTILIFGEIALSMKYFILLTMILSKGLMS